MINNYLAKTTGDLGGAFSGERIVYSLEMTLLGLGAVFAVLAIIWAVLMLFKVFAKTSSKEAADKEDNASVVENLQGAVTQPAVQQSDDDATVAAIIAAISAYLSSDEKISEEYAGGFRVVSFRRVRDKASWNAKK